AVVRHISDRIAVMYLGWIVEVSSAAELYENPLHPYTISLLSAVPIPDPIVERQRQPILLAGDLPSPANPPPACRFHTRCPFVQPTRCRDEIPPLRKDSSGHEVACHWAEEIKEGRIKPHEREPVLEAPPQEQPEGLEPCEVADELFQRRDAVADPCGVLVAAALGEVPQAPTESRQCELGMFEFFRRCSIKRPAGEPRA